MRPNLRVERNKAILWVSSLFYCTSLLFQGGGVGLGWKTGVYSSFYTV